MSDPCYLQIRVQFFSKNRIGFRLFFYGNTAVHNNIGTGHDLNCRKSSVVVGIIGGIRAGALISGRTGCCAVVIVATKRDNISGCRNIFFYNVVEFRTIIVFILTKEQ